MSSRAVVSLLIDRYLAGDLPFMKFWAEFMDAYAGGELTEDEEREFEPAYDIIHMGAPGGLNARDRGDGLLEERDVRVQLAAFQASRHGLPSV